MTEFIPVARIADLLLQGGEEFDYNGKRPTYPDTHLVYWAGGNPFHHRQDLNRLARAWKVPDTMICHEPFWNTLARHCDIVLPATTRWSEPISGAAATTTSSSGWNRSSNRWQRRKRLRHLLRSRRRLGVHERFTESRTAEEWLEHIYSRFRSTIPAVRR